MTSVELHTALLRPAVLQILRAAGFSYAKPAVIDTVTDLAARYLLLLSSSTAQNAFDIHNTFVPTVQDVRLALTQAGALMPQMGTAEEILKGTVEIDGVEVPFEDLRGVEGFVNWAQGSVNKDIRRIAGFAEEGGEAKPNVEEIAAGLDDKEDYLMAMKKKHSKTGEESRYQGTVLGKDFDLQPVVISGGPGHAASLAEWQRQSLSTIGDPDAGASPATSGMSSAPPSPVDDSHLVGLGTPTSG